MKRVFCSSCGKELPADSRFCNACGAQTATDAAGETKATPKSIKDEEIRTELKKYKQHTAKPFSCLECGYEGLMGMSTETAQGWKRRKGILKGVIVFVVLAIISFLVFTSAPPGFGPLSISPLFWVGIFVSGIAATLAGNTTKHYRNCPNCKHKCR
jgi:uncharacterized membrane protein YvbJ